MPSAPATATFNLLQELDLLLPGVLTAVGSLFGAHNGPRSKLKRRRDLGNYPVASCSTGWPSSYASGSLKVHGVSFVEGLPMTLQ